MAEQRRMPNPLALAVLGCLAWGPRHPYDIAGVLRARGQDAGLRLSYGSLYSVMTSLRARGLVRETEMYRDGGRPPRTVYGLTDDGDRELVSWLSDVLSTPGRDVGSLGPGLSMLVWLSPDVVIGLLEQRAERLRFELRAVQAARDAAVERGLADLMSVEREYRAGLLRAELDFTTALTHGVRAGELDGMRAWRRLDALRSQGVSMPAIRDDPAGFLDDDARALGLMPVDEAR